MALGDRIVVMSRGKVAQVGTPRQICFQPSKMSRTAMAGRRWER